jgi:hypothetical protein
MRLFRAGAGIAEGGHGRVTGDLAHVVLGTCLQMVHIERPSCQAMTARLSSSHGDGARGTSRSPVWSSSANVGGPYTAVLAIRKFHEGAASCAASSDVHVQRCRTLEKLDSTTFGVHLRRRRKRPGNLRGKPGRSTASGTHLAGDRASLPTVPPSCREPDSQTNRIASMRTAFLFRFP